MDTREQPALVVSVAAALPAAAPAPMPATHRPVRSRSAAPGQLLCCQLAIALGTFCLGQPWPVAAIAAIGAGALVVTAVVRSRGRWLYQLVVTRCRFLLRARRHDLPDNTAKARTLLGLLLPGSTIRTVHIGHRPATVISRPSGPAAIIRPRTVSPPLIASFPAPAELLVSAALPELFGIQTVFHAGARPGAPRRAWLTLHLSRTVEILTDDELNPLLHNGLRLIQRALHEAGVRSEPVPEDAALTAITALTHLARGGNTVREEWRYLRMGSVSQACFLLARDDRPDLQRLTGTLLARSPGVAVTVTRTARWNRGQIATGTLLRLAATNQTAIDAAAGHAARLLSPAAIRLTRLDGAHLSGVAASLPIGGLPR